MNELFNEFSLFLEGGGQFERILYLQSRWGTTCTKAVTFVNNEHVIVMIFPTIFKETFNVYESLTIFGFSLLSLSPGCVCTCG